MLTDVVVLDGDRKPVTGLTAQDFVVLEDGRPRPILAVSPVVLPSRNTDVPWPDPGTVEAPASITTNQVPAEGRLVAIMFDRSIPMEGPTVNARKIARAAVDALGPADLAAVVRSTGFSNEGVSRGFTADRALLMAAVNAPFVGLVNPPTMGTGGLVRSAPDLSNTGDCLCGLCVLEAIERTANAMAAARTRHKMIVWIGSAIVIQSGRASTATCQSLRDQRERTLRSLSNANVTFHVLDPSGLQTMARMADAFAGDPSRAGAANLERQADLRVLPAFTGGRTVLNTNQPELEVSRIFDETSSYYLLAFTPNEPADSVRPRRIQVRVGLKDVDVRVRTSVYTPGGTVPPSADPLEDVVGRLLPEPGVPMELALLPTFDASGSPQVVAQIGVAGPAGSDVDILIAAFDDQAKTVVNRRTTLMLSDSGKREIAETLPLEGGHYEIRVGARIKSVDAFGSVHGHVQVPARASDVLAVSGVFLSPHSNAVSAPVPASAPTQRWTFSPTESLDATVYVRRSRDRDGRVAVNASVVDRSGRLVSSHEAVLATSDGSSGDRTVDRVVLPIGALGVGDYIIRADVNDGRSRVQTATQFAVK